MSQKQNLMTTGEFAKATGIPTAKVSELIRAGKIEAKKVSNRWQIDKSQLAAKAVVQYGKSAPAGKKVADRTAAAKGETPAAKNAYSVVEFAAMTYLTEKGVLEWLKSGRLKGRMGSTGEWSVDAGNLQAADISRLVRE